MANQICHCKKYHMLIWISDASSSIHDMESSCYECADYDYSGDGCIYEFLCRILEKLKLSLIDAGNAERCKQCRFKYSCLTKVPIGYI